MEHLVTFLNTIVEKHLIPTMISIFMTICIYSITPTDNTILLRVGIPLYLLQLFTINFLIVVFIRFIFRGINNRRATFRNKKFYTEHSRNENRIKLEQLWKYVDSLTPSEIKILETFIESNNKPIIEAGNVFHAHGSLLNSDFVHKRLMQKEGSDSFGYISEGNIRNLFEQNNLYSEYVLESDFFILLKYSKEKYGRISHFQ